MTNVIDMRKLREAREQDELHPSMPADLVRLSDGSWLCSAASLTQLRRCFARYGFELNPVSSFAEFEQVFSFILRSSTMQRYMDDVWFAEVETADMLSYLRVVKAGDNDAVKTLRHRVFALKSTAPSHAGAMPPVRTRPTLVAVTHP